MAQNNAINKTSEDFTVDNLFLDGNTLSTTSGQLNLTPLAGQNIVSTTPDFFKIYGVAGTQSSFTLRHDDNTNSASHAMYQVYSGGASGGDPGIYFTVNGVQNWSLGIDNSDSDKLKITTGVNPSNGSDFWTMTKEGERTLPSQPAFLAYLASGDTNVTGNNTSYIIGTNVALTEQFDQNADFNTNGTFTAPVTGKYNFSACAHMVQASMGSATTFNVQINTSNRNYRNENATASSNEPNIQNNSSVTADLDSADTMQVQINVFGIGADTADLFGSTAPRTYISGFLAC